MFYYLNGTITVIEANLTVVDCGGVGYACRTTGHTISQLAMGKTHKLFTHCNIKEDAFDIYGFSTTEEMHSFQMLLSVNGVGPKAALAILSVSTPSSFALAVVTGDEKAITMAQGVGKKLAQRIILELKDKIAGVQMNIDASGGAPTFQVTGGHVAEATAALSSLGYTPSEIGAVMRKLDVEKMTVEELVRQALRAMVMK